MVPKLKNFKGKYKIIVGKKQFNIRRHMSQPKVFGWYPFENILNSSTYSFKETRDIKLWNSVLGIQQPPPWPWFIITIIFELVWFVPHQPCQGNLLNSFHLVLNQFNRLWVAVANSAGFAIFNSASFWALGQGVDWSLKQSVGSGSAWTHIKFDPRHQKPYPASECGSGTVSKLKIY